MQASSQPGLHADDRSATVSRSQRNLEGPGEVPGLVLARDQTLLQCKWVKNLGIDASLDPDETPVRG